MHLEGEAMADRNSQPRLSPPMILIVPVVVALLVAIFAWPGAKQEPRDLPVGVAGPPAGAERLEQGLAAAPGSFDLHRYANASDARAAIEDRDVYGAFVAGTDGPEVLVATGASFMVASMLEDAAAAAPPAGARPQVVDVAPGGSGDPRGTGLGSTALPLVLAGALVGIAASFLPTSLLGRAGLVTIGSLLAGAAALAIVQAWLDVLDHNWLANWGALSLIVLAVGSLVAGATALLGPPGIAVGVLPMMVIGNPLAAVASAPQLLPEPLGAIGQLFPPGAGGNLLRSTAYFDGAAAAGHTAVLAAWAAIGFGAIGLAAAPRRRRGAVPSGSRATRSMTRTAH
jgi:hypothetical protein